MRRNPAAIECNRPAQTFNRLKGRAAWAAKASTIAIKIVVTFFIFPTYAKKIKTLLAYPLFLVSVL